MARRACLAVAIAVTGLLAPALSAQVRRTQPATAAAGPQERQPPARPPSSSPVRPPHLGGKSLRLDVRLSTDHWEGDIHVPEQWATEMRPEGPGVFHFRYTRLAGAPSTVSYEVYQYGLPARGAVRAKGSNGPTAPVRAGAKTATTAPARSAAKTGTTTPARSAAPKGPATPTGPTAHILASGSLGAPPREGQSREFDIDFTTLLPAKPNGRDYFVRLVGPDATGTKLTWSEPLRISYKYGEVTQFPLPRLTRVVGTVDGLGHELKQGETPVAVITRRFRVEGLDIDQIPAETMVQLVQGGTVVAEIRPMHELTQKLPSGGTAFVLQVPASLARGTYQVQVKTSWGTTGQLPLFVGGNRAPNVGAWQLLDGGSYANHDWTEECQGIATDGHYWYITSNNDGKRKVYKFTINMHLAAEADLERYGSAHAGALDCFDNKLYIALEEPKQLLVMPTDLSPGTLYQLTGGPSSLEGSFPWCAINPITGELYTSNFYGGSYSDSWVARYRRGPGSTYEYVSSVTLSYGHGVTRVQGGAITSGGKLLLVNDADPFGIRVYNVFTGKYYGTVPYSIDTSDTVAEESEGLAVSPPGTAVVRGNAVNVHLVILDNDAPDQDDVLFKHVVVPDLDDLFAL